jgi:hypothetical protein
MKASLAERTACSTIHAMPYHDDTGDKLSHAYYCYLADKFERDPTLLEIPLKTIERWIQRGTWGVDKLREWEQLIHEAQKSREGMNSLSRVLRDDDEETRFFKGFDPFPAVLEQHEKRQFACASRH